MARTMSCKYCFAVYQASKFGIIAVINCLFFDSIRTIECRQQIQRSNSGYILLRNAVQFSNVVQKFKWLSSALLRRVRLRNFTEVSEKRASYIFMFVKLGSGGCSIKFEQSYKPRRHKNQKRRSLINVHHRSMKKISGVERCGREKQFYAHAYVIGLDVRLSRTEIECYTTTVHRIVNHFAMYLAKSFAIFKTLRMYNVDFDIEGALGGQQ